MSPLEKINQNLEAHAYEFSCPLTFTYTVGIALERFFSMSAFHFLQSLGLDIMQ